MKVWSGTLDTAATLNQDVVTAFPVFEAVGRLEPGVYVMVAQPEPGRRGERRDSYDTPRDAMVRGLRSRAHRLHGPGRRPRLRALARERRAGRRRRGAARRAQQRGPRHEGRPTPPGTSRSIPASRAARAAWRPASWWRRSPAITASSISASRPSTSPTAASRAARRRAPSTPSCTPSAASTASGETAFLTALLRDGRGAAIGGLPLTLVVRRPDGVEYRRAVVEDQGLGGRALAIPILPGAARGTWRVAAYTDPKGAAVGEATFLVEDYVPERLEVTLTPKRAGAAARRARRDRRPRPLPVRRAGRRPRRCPATSRWRPRRRMPSRASRASRSASTTSRSRPRTTEIEESATTDAAGRATLQVPVAALSDVTPTEARISLRVAEEGGRAVERSVTLPILPKGPVVGVRKNFRRRPPGGRHRDLRRRAGDARRASASAAPA